MKQRSLKDVDLANLSWTLDTEAVASGQKPRNCLYFDASTKSLRSTDCFDGMMSCTLCQFPESRQIFRLKYECDPVLDFESHYFLDYDNVNGTRILYGILGKEFKS